MEVEVVYELPVEYEVWSWEKTCRDKHLVTEDFDKVLKACEELKKAGIEYDVYRVTAEVLDL